MLVINMLLGVMLFSSFVLGYFVGGRVVLHWLAKREGVSFAAYCKSIGL